MEVPNDENKLGPFNWHFFFSGQKIEMCLIIHSVLENVKCSVLGKFFVYKMLQFYIMWTLLISIYRLRIIAE